MNTQQPLEAGAYAAGDNLPDAISHLIGSDYDDDLTGRDGSDETFEGGKGADKINGMSGSDTASYRYSDAGVKVDLGLTTAQSGGDA